MKKTVSLLLVFVMALTLMPLISVSADSSQTITIEAEDMTLVTGEGQVQNMDSMFPGSGFSGGKQFWFKNTAVGGVLELEFTLDAAFSGEMKFAHCMAGDFGIFDVYVDDQLMYDELDMYLDAGIIGSSVKHSGDVYLGYIELDAGEHILKLVCTGRNAANTKESRHYGSVDCIMLSSGYDYYDYDTPVTFEGEDMSITALPNFERQTFGGSFGISGGKQMLHKIRTAGASMKLSFTTTEDYTGEIYAAFCNAGDFGIYDVYLDSVLKIDNYDAYSSSPTRGVVLLDANGLSAGDHTIEFVSTATKNASSTGHLIAFDCLQLGETDATVIFEGEDMTPELTSHPDYLKQDMTSIGRTDFSGNKMARYNANIGHGVFNMTFKTEKAFEGNAYLYLCTAADFGIYDIYLDDVLLKDNYDCYSTPLARAEVLLENIELLPGSHTLKFVGQDKNTASTNHLLGIDCLTLGEEPDYDIRYSDVVSLMTDFKALALLPSEGEIGAAATSYDRVSYYDEATDTYVNWGDRVEGATHGQGWTSNADGFGYIEAVDGDPVKGIVALDVTGAGAIYRSFFATVGTGHIQVYVDGELTIDMPVQDYVTASGKYEGLDNLVYITSAKGYNNYVPITFNESCKIILCGGREKIDTDEGFWGRYFAFNYRLFDEGLTVEPTRSEFTAIQLAALEAADETLGSCGASDAEATASETKDVTAGDAVTMLTLSDEGAITSLKVRFNDKLTEAERVTAMQKLELSIFWDGEETPSVWAPIGDFFGTSMGGTYSAYPMGMSDYSTFYSNWYMPYANGAKVVIDNLSENDYNITVEAVTEAIDGNIADYGRFHAKWSQNRFIDEKRPYDFTVLKTEGAGRFLGFNLHIYNIVDVYWWGEGDEKFFVNGEKFPSTYGTGSEDYFGYAWCSANYFNEAYHAQNSTPGTQGLMGNYNNVRFHFGDSVPFTDSFEAAMEKFHGDDYTQYAATSYWYLDANGEDPYTPVTYTGEDAELRYMSLTYELDKLNAPVTTNVIEGENMVVISQSGGGAYWVQDMASLAGDGTFSGNKHLFSGQGVTTDGEMTLRFSVSEDFEGTLQGAFCKAADYGTIQIYIDDVALGDPIDCYSASLTHSGLISLGDVSLEAGAHEMTIEVVGKNASSRNYLYSLDFITLGEHVLTLNEAVTPTCVGGGNIEYWSCADCDAIFEDLYGMTAIEGSPELPIDESNHVGETELRDDKEATDTEAGYTGDLYCLACGNIAKKGEIIPAESIGTITTDVGFMIYAPDTTLPGSLITVDIMAATLADTAKELSSINFTLTYDPALTLKSVTKANGIGGTGISNGDKFGWYYDVNNGGITVEAGVPVKIATAVFNVGNVTEATEAVIGLSSESLLNVTLSDDDLKIGFTPDVISDSVMIPVTDFEFIEADEYMALAADQKILAIPASTEGTNDTVYTLTYADNSTETLYYSSRYDKYVAIVDADLTETDIAGMLAAASGTAPEIAYGGDINGDGRITAGDAALISDMLHSYTNNSTAADMAHYTDIMRLEADITGTYSEGSGYVTITDAMRVLNLTVGIE